MHKIVSGIFGDITLDLNVGVNATWGDSAEGKTYIYTCLQAEEVKGAPWLLTITYDSKRSKEQLLTILQNVSSAVELIYLDRAPLYVDQEVARVLMYLGESHCVFVDFKDWIGYTCLAPWWCSLDFTREGVYLYVDSDF